MEERQRMVSVHDTVMEWVMKMYEIRVKDLDCTSDGYVSINNCLEHIREAVCKQAYEDWRKEDIDARHCL